MNNSIKLIKGILYGMETILLIVLGIISWRGYTVQALPEKNPTLEPETITIEPTLQPITPQITEVGISRALILKTNVPPDRPKTAVIQYTIEKGDSAWSIASKYKLKPESILWANDGLSAEANNLKIGAQLNIPPVDGVLHKVLEGDTVEAIALLHGVTVDEILGYIGNRFDLTQIPKLAADQLVIVPNGTSTIVWDDPEPVAAAGVKGSGGYTGPMVNLGTGTFIWPVGGTILLTQEYWGGHPAIDINTYYRQPVFASDSGTVVFAGWSKSGYGNLIIIDHGNGYRTYYAHNEALLVSVGQGVVQGQQIAESGSTGNSTGNHLDFRIRATGGGFYNPMDFLP
jgi:murein DD-endopeptidase MepM/ murein hydrolase activator NlpD